jgi:hypothetical protein
MRVGPCSILTSKVWSLRGSQADSLGRPERVSLVVNRTVINRGKNKTPGRFATEVIRRDVAPQLQIHYKSSKAKAYLKEGRALRVEDHGQQPGRLRRS